MAEAANIYFLIVEARSSRSRYKQRWFLGRLFFLAWSSLLPTGAYLASLYSAEGDREREIEISGVSSSFFKDTSLTSLELHSVTSFNHNYLIKGPVYQYSHLGD